MPFPRLWPTRTDLLSTSLPGLLLILVFVSASGVETVHAQEAAPPTTGSAAVPTKEKVDSIPISDIGVESERSKSRLSSIGESISARQEIEEIALVVPTLKKEVDEQFATSKQIRRDSATPYDLDRLEVRWNDVRTNLASLQTQLRDRGHKIEVDLEAIRNVRELWKVTRQEAVDQEVNPEVLLQIDEVDRAAELTLAKGSKRQAYIVGVQSKIASLDELAVADLKTIQAIREALTGDVLQRDAPPLWSPSLWEQLSREEVLGKLGEQWAREREMMSEYATKHRDELIGYGIFTLVILASMLSIQRSIRRHFEDEDELAPVRAIFSHPIALTLLLATYLGYFISPAAIGTYSLIAGPMMLLSAVVILRDILDRPFYPILNVVVVLYLVEQLAEFLYVLPTLPRFFLILEMLFGALFLMYWLRPRRLSLLPHEMVTTVSFRVVGIGLRIALLMAFFAFAAEACGFRSLAKLVGGSLVSASFSAVIIYGATRVLDGIFVYLLRIRPLRLLGMVSRHRWLIRERGLKALQLLGWYIWATVTLRGVQLLDEFEQGLAGLMNVELPFAAVAITLGDILACVVTYWVATLISRFVRFVLEEDVYTRVHLAKGRPYAITTLAHYTILLIGLTLAMVALGLDMNRFTLLAGAFGVGIGFGLQSIVNNFISGIILLTERPIEVGDTIAMGASGSGGEVFGEVTRIGIRSSTVRTWQGAEVLVPNSDLVAQQVTNWTLSDRRRRLEIPVGVTYGSDPAFVSQVLLGVATDRESILDDPKPYVLFMGFGESSLDFEVRAWTDEFDSYLSVRSSMCIAISEALNEAGLKIPFPQRDLHVKTIVGQPDKASGDTPA
jgi:potassium efflux system protein